MPVYLEALNEIENDPKYGPIVREEIEELMHDWLEVPYIMDGKLYVGFGRHIVPNIKTEEFLPVSYMKEILVELHENKNLLIKDATGYFIDSNIYTFENIYQNKCNDLKRKAIEIKISRPYILGNAVKKRKFLHQLMDKNCISELNAVNVLNLLLTNPMSLKTFQKNYIMEQDNASMWATWNEFDSNLDPFHFATTPFQANKVRVNLGLSRKFHKGTLLLLNYVIPSTLKLRYPTIADAGVFEYFSPADETYLHGLTKPWFKHFILDYWKVTDVKPRPETVHKNIRIGFIINVEEAN